MRNSFLLLIVATMTVLAQPQNTLKGLRTELDKAKKSYPLKDMSSVPCYSEALGYIAAADKAAADAPAHPMTGQAVQVAQAATECAIAQMQSAYSIRTMVKLQDSLIQVLQQTQDVVMEISSQTSGKLAQMESDLAAEREKARKLREEADRKFAELQSSLIQVTNNARGTIISMSDILFETGKADLTPDLRTSLAKISGILLVFKTSHVIIEGHTDNQGSDEFNMQLSAKRANNVRDFMIAQGVQPERLKAVGFGFNQPIADNATPEGRQKNRRVDLVVQENK